MTPNWLRLVFRRSTRRRTTPDRPTRVSACRLGLATLEDRLAPAGFGHHLNDPPGGHHGAHAHVRHFAPDGPTQRQAQAEIRFLKGMIDHHHMAVMTAELCVERAVHAELREMCEDIATTQMAEIEQMQGWLEDWYGITYEPRMTPGMENEVDRLAALSGQDFEVAFLEMMIEHHQGAIKEARKIADRAFHPELVALANNIIAAQSAEIAMMREWLRDWYGIEPNSPAARHSHCH